LATALGKITTHPDRHVLRASVGIRQGSRSRLVPGVAAEQVAVLIAEAGHDRVASLVMRARVPDLYSIVMQVGASRMVRQQREAAQARPTGTASPASAIWLI
jgi:hypothetical protein